MLWSLVAVLEAGLEGRGGGGGGWGGGEGGGGLSHGPAGKLGDRRGGGMR